jgi:hypothetical protein
MIVGELINCSYICIDIKELIVKLELISSSRSFLIIILHPLPTHMELPIFYITHPDTLNTLIICLLPDTPKIKPMAEPSYDR